MSDGDETNGGRGAGLADAATREGRLINALLVLCAVLLGIAATLGVALFLQWHSIGQERGALAAREALLDDMLAGEDSDLAVIPHTAPGVSFVLNPGLGEATFKAGDAGPYQVSSLGLRGAAIGKKARDVTRVALVGDSVFFGWKLRDDDRLEAVLSRLAADKVSNGGRVEFVTIALPGWNTRDQAAFLRHHLGQIDPDYIVWSLIRNDLIDTPGAIPPGLLASWNSPQRDGLSSFEFARPDTQLDLPSYSTFARWRENLELIRDFGEAHSVGVSLLWWRSRQRAIIDHLHTTVPGVPPTVHLPAVYRYDEANWCVAPPDCHPTRWANEKLAIGLLQELADRDVLELSAWDDAQQAVVAAFADEASALTNEDDRREFFAGAAAQLPVRIAEDDRTDGLASVGLYGRTMTGDGMLLLRADPDADTLQLRLRPIPLLAPQPLDVAVALRSIDGRRLRRTHSLQAGDNRIDLAIPRDAPYGVVELAWSFSRVECVAPSRCVSARLLSVTVD